jgi:anti-sigma B factor antagonist
MNSAPLDHRQALSDTAGTTDRANRFSVTVRRREPAVNMRLGGELDLAAEPKIVEALLRAMADHADLTIIDLDLTSVEFIDSHGVRALLHCRDVAAARGRELQLTDVKGPVTRLLELVGIDERLHPAH